MVLYSAVHFSGFKPDFLYTLSVRLCTLCMVAVHSNLCCVCTLCIPVEREGSLLARIGYIGQLTEVEAPVSVATLRSFVPTLWCAPRIEGPLVRGGWGDRIWRRTARSPLILGSNYHVTRLRRHKRSRNTGCGNPLMCYYSTFIMSQTGFSPILLDLQYEI